MRQEQLILGCNMGYEFDSDYPVPSGDRAAVPSFLDIPSIPRHNSLLPGEIAIGKPYSITKDSGSDGLFLDVYDDVSAVLTLEDGTKTLEATTAGRPHMLNGGEIATVRICGVYNGEFLDGYIADLRRLSDDIGRRDITGEREDSSICTIDGGVGNGSERLLAFVLTDPDGRLYYTGNQHLRQYMREVLEKVDGVYMRQQQFMDSEEAGEFGAAKETEQVNPEGLHTTTASLGDVAVNATVRDDATQKKE